ncbi:MAG: type II toxin-antitoxin system VapC family toxin [Candidatus Micrarchaeota archaeon]|nr:type II toxin-antitoxin system VapC family toxin [Candidatus Micrarchaeota archaeon]
MSEAVFDTNILVDHLNNSKEATALVKQVEDGLLSGYVSTITLAELFSGKEADDPVKRKIWSDLLDLFTKIEVSEDIAKSAGEMRRRHRVNLADALIAATASSLRCKLFTQNIRDFEGIVEITAEKPY